MGSYVAFYLAGLYPLPATRQFLLSSPYFPEISFFNPVFNKTTTIKSKGFRGNPTSGTGGHVFVQVLFIQMIICRSGALRPLKQSVAVDGRPYKSSCYLDWDLFTNGSMVELTLSDNINLTCGKGKDALPPSLSTGGYT